MPNTNSSSKRSFLLRLQGSSLSVIIFSILVSLANANWVAFNDCVYRDGQHIAKNITKFGIGRGNPHPESGNLLDQSNGSDTGAKVTFLEHKSTGNSINSATDKAEFANGSDAANIFNDFVDATGNMSYNDGPGWYLDLKIEGLDSAGQYTFVGTVQRNGGGGYKERVTNWKILDAKAFKNESSKGVHTISEDSIEFSTGDNSSGYVARWTGIQSGDDGTIIIRTSHSIGSDNGGIDGAHAYKGYAGGVFMLEFHGRGTSVKAKGKLTTMWSLLKSTY